MCSQRRWRQRNGRGGVGSAFSGRGTGSDERRCTAYAVRLCVVPAEVEMWIGPRPRKEGERRTERSCGAPHHVSHGRSWRQRAGEDRGGEESGDGNTN